MSSTEPTPMKAGSTLRFRVQDPLRGVESVTWSLVGAKRTGDLFFAAREVMGDVKLSLHESGIKRMAWTSEAAQSRLEPGMDRVLSRWTDAAAMGGGWSIVLRLDISDSALSQMLPPIPGRPLRPVVTVPAAGPGRTIHIWVMLGTPECDGLRLEVEMLEVGRMVLGDGSKVLVAASDHPTTAESEAQLADIRGRACADGALERPTPRAWAWGWDIGTKIPFVLDAGDPRPPGAVPDEIPRYTGPPDVVVVEVDPPLIAEPPPELQS